VLLQAWLMLSIRTMAATVLGVDLATLQGLPIMHRFIPIPNPSPTIREIRPFITVLKSFGVLTATALTLGQQ